MFQDVSKMSNDKILKEILKRGAAALCSLFLGCDNAETLVQLDGTEKPGIKNIKLICSWSYPERDQKKTYTPAGSEKPIWLNNFADQVAFAIASIELNDADKEAYLRTLGYFYHSTISKLKDYSDESVNYLDVSILQNRKLTFDDGSEAQKINPEDVIPALVASGWINIDTMVVYQEAAQESGADSTLNSCSILEYFTKHALDIEVVVALLQNVKDFSTDTINDCMQILVSKLKVLVEEPAKSLSDKEISFTQYLSTAFGLLARYRSPDDDGGYEQLGRINWLTELKKFINTEPESAAFLALKEIPTVQDIQRDGLMHTLPIMVDLGRSLRPRAFGRFLKGAIKRLFKPDGIDYEEFSAPPGTNILAP